MSLRRDLQFSIANSELHLITATDSQRFAHEVRNEHTSIPIYSASEFTRDLLIQAHCIFP
jgi:hypothetical protein